MAKLLVYGEAYAWANVEIYLLGALVVGVSAIKYDDEQEMEDKYGQGIYPVSRAKGNYKATGSITLQREELEKLQRAAPDGRLQSIPEFDITVSFIMDDATRTTTHRLVACRFKQNGRELSQNDKGGDKEIELQIAQILWRA